MRKHSTQSAVLAAVWENLAVPLPRLVYADVLDDIGSHKAAIRQRNYAKIIEQSELMIYMPLIQQVYGWIRRNNHHGRWKRYRLKPDGSLTYQPLDMSSLDWNSSQQIHVLKGDFRIAQTSAIPNVRPSWIRAPRIKARLANKRRNRLMARIPPVIRETQLFEHQEASKQGNGQ